MATFSSLNTFCILHDTLPEGFAHNNIISRVAVHRFPEVRLLQISTL